MVLRTKNDCFSIHYLIRRARKIAISDYVCPSVRPHGTTRLPLNGFPRNLIFEYFSKICQEKPRFIEIGQE